MNHLKEGGLKALEVLMYLSISLVVMSPILQQPIPIEGSYWCLGASLLIGVARAFGSWREETDRRWAEYQCKWAQGEENLYWAINCMPYMIRKDSAEGGE